MRIAVKGNAILAQRLAALLLACCAGAVTAGAADGAAFFEKRIRPTLIAQCYKCHSLESKKEKGGLRVDSREALLAGGESGPAIVPGKPAASLLLKAIRRTDPELSMPPKSPPLSPELIADFERWIQDGAEFPASLAGAKPSAANHWAFQPVRIPPVPDVKNAAWPRTEVDCFLLAPMEAAGLAPLGDASAALLARRLYFALTGLPPAPEEVAAFAAAAAADPQAALAALADKLLAGPEFGERWARHWLDLVRYADSKGHEYDEEIYGAWRYRDYVVRALNADLPYDQFVREQIAGDLLPPRVDPQSGCNEALLATAWWNLGEAVTAPVDLANDEGERIDNQIEVLGKTFNALTLGCARCHDHKFDPISMREYYGLFGVLAASPLRRGWMNDSHFQRMAADLRSWRERLDATPVQAARGRQTLPVPALDCKDGTVLADFINGVPAGWRLDGHAEVVAAGSAVKRGLPHGLWSGTLSKRLPALLRSQTFTIEHEHIDVLAAGQDATVQIVIANYQMIKAPLYDGLKHSLSGGSAAWHWQRFNVGRWRGRRAHIDIFSGKVFAEHALLKTDDTPQAQFGVRAVLLNNGPLPSAPPAACELELEQPETDGALAAEFAQLAALENTIQPPERALVVADNEGADAPLFTRGDANKPRADTAPRRYLAAAGARDAAGAGSGRRELAAALLSPANPLTARVAVNRVWQHLFGRGLSATVDNFGSMGEAPTHPPLLDFLAARFVSKHRWSLKRLIRELVLSRAWQLESAPFSPADPENKLWTRFPLRRLEGEAIRDAILTVAGTLDRTVGGPPISVPHNLALAGSGTARPSGPLDGECRRSIYLAVWRNYPSKFLDVFDQPASTNTFGRRDVSNVATQALTLLNDPFVAGQARKWARRVRALPLSPEQRVQRMYQEAFARAATAPELARALALAGDADAGWDDLALALFNLKEFIHVR